MQMTRTFKLLLTAILALALLLPAGAAAAVDGKAAFKAQRCNSCHAIKAAGVTRDADPEEDGKDLSKVGAKRDKKWIAKYLLKKVEVDGQKHKKRFQGSKDELKAIATWLGSLK